MAVPEHQRELGARWQAQRSEGQTVAEVRVVDASGKPVAEKIPALPLVAGKPFDFGVERESLRALYRTGDYSDVRVSVSPGAQGWRVDFVVELNLFNNVVRISGLKKISADRVGGAGMPWV